MRKHLQLQRELQLLQASGASPEQIYKKKRELLLAERGDLIAQREFQFGNAEKILEINQKIADKGGVSIEDTRCCFLCGISYR